MSYYDDDKPCRACVSVEELMKKGKQMAQKQMADKKDDAKDAGTSNGASSSTTTVRHDCPVDKDELGRSTWNLLHTMSVYYPEKPNDDEQRNMTSFMTTLGKRYPCDFCAKDLRKDLKKDPPKVASREEFAQWMCQLHNKVNSKIGKPIFDCSKVFERWKDGWKDGSCDY